MTHNVAFFRRPTMFLLTYADVWNRSQTIFFWFLLCFYFTTHVRCVLNWQKTLSSTRCRA